ELTRLAGHGGAVSSAAWSPDGTRILTVSDKTARMWEAGTGKELARVGGRAGGAGWRPGGAPIVTVADQTRRAAEAAGRDGAGEGRGPRRRGWERGVEPTRGADNHGIQGQNGAGMGGGDRNGVRQAEQNALERGMEPRRGADRHRVPGQNGAGMGGGDGQG